MIQQQGIYSISDAARLVGITAGRLRRWLDHRYELVPGGYKDTGFTGVLTYKDLLEARVITALRKRISLPKIRDAAREVHKLYNVQYPLISGQLLAEVEQHVLRHQDNNTDSKIQKIEGERLKRLLVKFPSNQNRRIPKKRLRKWQSTIESLVEADSKQLVIAGLIATEDMINALDRLDAVSIAAEALKDVERRPNGDFGAWKPLIGGGKILLDPEQLFGTPLIARVGVPTRDIAIAFREYDNRQSVEDIYQIEPDEFDAAIAFEGSLADALKNQARIEA